ncbi:MAG: rod shape-determining protein MreD [Venatoribacter sp.]
MLFRAIFLTVCLFFVGFVLEQISMPNLLSWFTPPWTLLILTMLVLQAPQHFGLWLAIPLGLMLDALHFQPLGLNVVTLAVHVVFIQAGYRRLARTSNFLVSMLVVGALVAINRTLTYLILLILGVPVQDFELWSPVLVSMLVWPWLYVFVYFSMRRLNLS